MKPRSLLWFVPALLLAAFAPIACSGDDGGGEKPGQDRSRCEADTDCGEGLVCGPAATCVECASDGHCPRAMGCDASTYTCRFRQGWGDECAAHEDCPLGMSCAQGLCLPTQLVTPCGGLGQCPPLDDGTPRRCNRELSVCEEDLGCFDNDDCLESEVCNPGTGKCERRCTAETEYEVCAARESCVEGRCVECTGNDDCGPGLVCNVQAGRCTGSGTCFTDRDCAAGTVCNQRTRLCTDTPPTCDSNDDCLPDERCDLARRRCVARACQDDIYEPNDDPESATALAPGSLSGLVVCGENEDWYAIRLRRGDRISVNIEADVLVSGGLEVQFRDSAGRILDQDPLLLDVTVPLDDTYFVRVRTLDSAARYSLHAVVVPSTPCTDDAYEANDTPAEASPLGTGEHLNLQICFGNPDWYVVEVPSGRSLEVTLEHNPFAGNLELAVFGENGSRELAADRSTEATKAIRLGGIAGGRAWVLVEPSDSRITNAYDLAISTQ